MKTTRTTGTNSFEIKFKLLLLKAYFDKGYGFTSPVKWLLAVLGITSQDYKIILVGTFFYVVSCFIFGWLFYKYDWIRAQAEIDNRFNLFQQQMRKKFKIKDSETFK